MTQPAFDPTQFGPRPSTPPIPMVVCWDDLDPTTYFTQLSDLAEWITWLRSTYRIPATVLPPCWFTHPAIREDIGHLWTGWLLTRHPDAGVGMIGLDWDQRRDATINRLREATAITGCTANRHQPEPEPGAAITTAAEELWHDHVDQQTRRRSHEAAMQAATDIVTDLLQAAELRHDLAPAILADVSESPATATDEDQEEVAQRLHQLAEDAVDRAAESAADAVRTILDTQRHTALETAVAHARDNIADQFATAALAGQPSSKPDDSTRHWLDTLETLLPAAIAAGRAAASAAARTGATDQRAAARRRHPYVEDLFK